jgi:serine/threonine protein phosphatase PrpC
MKIAAAGLTDIGCVRRSNEDNLGLFPELNLYLIADGMGGHAAGEVASKMAVETIKEFFTSPEITQQTEEARLTRAIAHANQRIYEASERDAALSGMGTTVVAVLAQPTEIIISFVGDSRVYLYQNGKVEQLTQDHSLVNEYIRKGLLTPEAAERHPLKHVLSRALGTNPTVEVEIARRIPASGDVLILCSDGLSNKLTHDEMNSILMEAEGDLEKTGRALVEKAKEKGGEDNITTILIRYHD